MTRKEAAEIIRDLLIIGSDWEAGYYSSDGIEALEMAIEALEQQEQEKGEWLCINGTIFCSECQGKALYEYNENDNDDFPFLLPIKSKRCPHCGARMEEEK